MRTFVLTILALGVLASGCGKKAPPAAPPPAPQRDLGGSCKEPGDCREGLACVQEHCVPASAGQARKELERAYEMGQDQADKAIEKADRPSAP